MQYNVSIEGDRARAIMSEDLSFADHAAFQSAIKELIGSGKELCVIDIANLRSVDSAGLGMFMIAHEECQKANCSLVLSGAQGQVLRMLDLARFDSILRIERAESSAA